MSARPNVSQLLL